MSIKIVAEATCNLFKEILDKKSIENVRIIKMSLFVGEKEYKCYDDDMDIAEFSKYYFEELDKGTKVHTSLVNPDAFEKVFREEVENGNKVICFTMASGISGTNQSANIAKDLINEEFKEEKVYVVDCMTCGFGEGLQVLNAAKLAKEGKSFDEIKTEVERFKHFVRSEFTVDEIKYLISTGRVSRAMAKFLTLANIKVLLKNNLESKIVFDGPAFGRKNAINKLADKVKDKIDLSHDQTVYITHCVVKEDAEKLKELIVNKTGIKEDKVEIYDYDLISGAHIGPRSLAVFYVSEKEFE